MTVYLVTGASRGLGYAFVQHLSKDPLNTVIGLVRNKSKTDAQISEDKLNQNSNIHIFSGDITSYKSLLDARAEVEKVTPKIDILINNAAAITVASAFNKLTDFQSDPDLLNSELQTHLTTNVIGVVNTINIFLPLVLKSDIKKVISISTGLADNDFTNNYDLYEAAPYSISKAALNATVAKYNAAHGKNSDRVLFLAIAPGFVATGNDGIPPPDSTMPQKFLAAYPHFTGPITPAQSVDYVMAVVDRANVDDKHFAGQFVSQFGNKQWL